LYREYYLNKMATVSIHKMGTSLNLNNIKVAFSRLSDNFVTAFNIYTCIN